MSNLSKYNPNIHHRRSIRLKGYDYSRSGAYFITICCEGRVCRFGNVVANEMILNEYGWVAYNEWIKLSERFSNFELDVFQIMPNHIHGIIVLVGETVGATVGATLAVAQNENDAVARNNMVRQKENDAVAQNNMAPKNDGDNNVGATLAVARNNMPAQNENDAVAQNNMPARNNMARQNDGDSDIGAGASPAPTVGTVGDIVGAYKSLVANGCLNIYKFRNEIMGKLWQRNYCEHIIKNERSYQTISNYIINNPVKWNADKFYPRGF